MPIRFRCPHCERLLGIARRKAGTPIRCPQCGEHRTPEMYHTLDGSSDLLDHTLAELGVPLWDIIGARAGMQRVFFEMTGDRELILGPLASG